MTSILNKNLPNFKKLASLRPYEDTLKTLNSLIQ